MHAHTNTYDYYKQMHDIKKKIKYKKFFKINFKIIKKNKNCNYDNKKNSL